MKYIKLYENYAKTGGYIIFDKYELTAPFNTGDVLYIWKEFLKNTIGIVKNIYYTMTNDKQITIVYNPEDVPKVLQNRFLDLKEGKYQRTFLYDNVKDFFTCSNNIDDLKRITDQNKYNL